MARAQSLSGVSHADVEFALTGRAAGVSGTEPGG